MIGSNMSKVNRNVNPRGRVLECLQCVRYAVHNLLTAYLPFTHSLQPIQNAAQATSALAWRVDLDFPASEQRLSNGNEHLHEARIFVFGRDLRGNHAALSPETHLFADGGIGNCGLFCHIYVWEVGDAEEGGVYFGAAGCGEGVGAYPGRRVF